MKLASFQRALHEWNSSNRPEIRPLYVNAGQHYDRGLAGRFIEELSVQIDRDLTDLIEERDPLRRTAAMMVQLFELFSAERTELDYIVTFGDANATLATALAAAKAGVRLVHVESGVRLGNRSSSEEINRIVADHLATLRFCTTPLNVDNLAREGLSEGTHWVGDLVMDLVVSFQKLGMPRGVAGLAEGSYVLASLHRNENLSRPEILEAAFLALESLGKTIVFIAHPRISATARRFMEDGFQKLVVLDGLGYRDTLSAIAGSRFLFTDSGAFQREAFYLQKRCVIRQDVAFWDTLIRAGVHRTCGATYAQIHESLIEMDRMVDLQVEYPQLQDFGDGTAGAQVLGHLAAQSQVGPLRGRSVPNGP